MSINFRTAEADDVPVFLIEISHSLLPEPLLISTDNAVLISEEPYIRGTQSTFGAETERDFLFVAMDAVLPDEEDGGDVTASLVIDVLDGDIVGILTSTIEPATCRIAIVNSRTPNNVELSYTGLQLVGAQGDWGEVALQFSMAPMMDEQVPYIRFTQGNFPGLFK